MSYTLAPWKQHRDLPLIIVDRNGREICDLTGSPHFEREGNATLIKAAPDLLSALKIAAEYMPTEDGAGTQRRIVNHIIAQAEGRPTS